jgi:2,3-bisphosphoglycerate-independent phosphoglycerate mutase
MSNQKRVLLAILDGWGHGMKRRADAITLAKTPFIDNLYVKYPSSELVTYGEQVGLPEGQMGNSEVGHMNIGAGRIVYQELTRISKSIRDKELQHNPVLLDALKYARENNKPVHFIGLVSDGGVHSHTSHLKALCEIAHTEGCHGFIHAFTDGRDCDPKSGLGFLKDVNESLKGKNFKIASIIGRYYAMDRDKRWERVKLAYDLMVHGTGEKVTDFEKVIEKSYANNVTDEFLQPMMLHTATPERGDDKSVKGVIKNGDVVISFNFRTDRPREITEVLTQKDFHEYNMAKLELRYVTMTRYDETYQNVSVIFEKDNLVNTLGEVISKAGLTQVRIAETEKYPHVTFFFSGGREEPFDGEKRIMVSSPKVATYDLQPEMSAGEITDKITAEIEANQPNFICLNYANTDMVGHTGVFKAAMKAAETVSKCAEILVKTALKYDYDCILIADHGNSDYMINDDGTPNTAHTMNPVPFIYVSKNAKKKRVRNGKLADLAPTIAALLGIQPSAEMDGENLIY